MESIKIKKVRIPVLDIVRVAAMLFMIQGHTIDALGDPSSINVKEFPWIIWHTIRGFTAPIFLIISGTVQVFANKKNEFGDLPDKTVFRRIRLSFILIALSYLMGLPVTHFSDFLTMNEAQWLRFYSVNILQLIGVSILFSLPLFKFIKNYKALGGVSFLVSILILFFTPLVDSVQWNSYTNQFFASYLTNKQGSLFPIFPFTSYMFFGIGFGCLLKQWESEKLDLAIIHNSKIILIVTFFAFLFYFDFSKSILVNLNSLPYYSPGLGLIRISFTMALLFIAAKIYKVLLPIEPLLKTLGKNALLIYVIHLFIIYGSPLTLGLVYFGSKSFSVFESISFALLVEVMALSIALFVDYSLKHWVKMKILYSLIVLTYLIFIFFF